MNAVIEAFENTPIAEPQRHKARRTFRRRLAEAISALNTRKH